MSIIRFLYDNKLDAATLVESSQVSTLPVENLQDADRTKIWRTTSKWLQWVQADLLAASTVKAVALINHNFYNVGCVIRLCGSSIYPEVGASHYGQTGRLWDWMFKDGTDRSSAGMTLTPHGTVGTPTIGWSDNFGFQCLFDRAKSQYWDHADNDALDVGTGDFTLMGWVKTNYSTMCQQIIDKFQIIPALGYFFSLFCSGAVARTSLKVASSSGDVQIYGNTTTLADNAWHHVAVVVDRTSNLARFYLDGSPDSDWQDISGISTGTLNNDVDFRIGSALAGTNFFNGYMGPMMLIKGKLTDGQIATAAAQPEIKEDLTYNSEIIIKNFTGGSYRYWRLEFANNNNPVNYIDIGRMFLGNYFEPTKTYHNIGLRESDPSNIDYSEGNVKYVDTKTSYQNIALDMRCISQYATFKTFLDNVGRHKDFFVELDYGTYPNTRSFYVHMDSEPEQSSIVTGKEYYNVSLNMRESR